MKNKILSDDGITLVVESTKGRTFTIDKEDECVLEHWWSVNLLGYVMRFENIYLHRILTNAPYNMEVDHKDLIKTNNCKSNLILSTHKQNCYNRIGKENTTSKYKGVCWNKKTNKWLSYINKNKLGSYNTEKEAALKYNEQAIILFKEFARLNIIE